MVVVMQVLKMSRAPHAETAAMLPNQPCPSQTAALRVQPMLAKQWGFAPHWALMVSLCYNAAAVASCNQACRSCLKCKKLRYLQQHMMVSGDTRNAALAVLACCALVWELSTSAAHAESGR